MTISPGGGTHVAAALIAQGHRQPVNLRFRHDTQVLVVAKAQKPSHPGKEIRHIGFVEGVPQREHRHPVGNGRKTAGRGRAHATRRAVVTDEIGELRLKVVKTSPQRIIGGIVDLRRIVDMVEPVVAADLPYEIIDLLLRLVSRHAISIRIRVIRPTNRVPVTIPPQSHR